MISIENTLVSEEIIKEEFVCNISQCKGECCVAGEAGAPLDSEEVQLLEDNKQAISEHLNSNGNFAIAQQGVAIKGPDGQWETPLVEGKECAYTVFSKEGIAKCGIEVAHKKGAISWKKPLSCHLYPIRIEKYSAFTAVNYHRWSICKAACDFGASLKIPVYQFLKEPLIRKFGFGWFKKLEETASQNTNQQS